MAAVSDFVALPGKGVQGMVAGHRIALGIAAMLADFGLHEPAVEALRNAGKTVMFVPRDVAFAGLVAAADTVKPGAAAVKALQAAGLRVIMATGDALATAGFVARLVGIGKVHAALLPEAKRDLMDLMHAKGARVAMAGDGVNDAPALATADVGLAMGHGADLAVQSAGMTLLSGDLAGIRRGHRLARVTLTNIRQNLVFAFAYHAIGIPIAAAAMSLSSVSVITNALRLRVLTL